MFDQAYQKLNDAQKQAVDAIDGPVMVVAGPGTGKTQILALRIANILKKTDTEPEQILALTFTEAAAQNMRRRLHDLIGSPAYRVVINTFHGFCNDVIKKYPEDFPRVIGSKSITDVDQISIVESIIESGEFELLKPWGDRMLYVRDIVSAISDLKREGIAPEKFQELVKTEQENFKTIPDLYHEKGVHKGKMKGDYQKLERKILKNFELAQIYFKYQEILAERKEYDFNDMIMEVLKAMGTSPALLQMLQEDHQYILVDEHQDTNNAQNKILELLMGFHENPNLFVVGDEKQAVFRFQGASLENFQYFRNRYPNVQLITLTENYRSTQNILDAADKLLSTAKLRKNSEHAENPIRVGEFATDAGERYFVAHDILEKINGGVNPSDIAILYRNNKDAFPIARDLARLGIAHRIESDQDLFTQSDVQKLLIILRAISDYGNDLFVTELIQLNLFGIDPLDAYKVLRNTADRKKYSLYDVISDEKLLGEVGLSNPAPVIEIGAKLKRWAAERRERDLVNFFEHVVRDSGMLDQILGSESPTERFAALGALFDEVKKLVEKNASADLRDFFAYLETVKKHKLFIKRNAQDSAESSVRMMTVHKSKGQEFLHVYVIRAVDGVFGGKTERDRLPLIDSIYKLEQ